MGADILRACTGGQLVAATYSPWSPDMQALIIPGGMTVRIHLLLFVVLIPSVHATPRWARVQVKSGVSPWIYGRQSNFETR